MNATNLVKTINLKKKKKKTLIGLEVMYFDYYTIKVILMINHVNVTNINLQSTIQKVF